MTLHDKIERHSNFRHGAIPISEHEATFLSVLDSAADRQLRGVIGIGRDRGRRSNGAGEGVGKAVIDVAVMRFVLADQKHDIS